jgi:sulfite exporter TauE/SafE
MHPAIAISVLVAAAVGSLHCAGMCGGLAAFATGGSNAEPRRRALALVAYNGARGLGYVLLGTLAGALGSTLDRAGVRVGVGRAAGAVAGLVMITWGVVKLLEARGVSVLGRAARAGALVPAASLLRKVRNQPPVVRSTIIGGCTAALPCGFLHAFLVLAAGTGSALQGALVTASFWLGTLPAMVGLGIGVNAVTGPLRRHAPVLGAIVLVGFGLSSLLGRWAPPYASLLHVSPEIIRNADSPPCHAR